MTAGFPIIITSPFLATGEVSSFTNIKRPKIFVSREGLCLTIPSVLNDGDTLGILGVETSHEELAEDSVLDNDGGMLDTSLQVVFLEFPVCTGLGVLGPVIANWFSFRREFKRGIIDIQGSHDLPFGEIKDIG